MAEHLPTEVPDHLDTAGDQSHLQQWSKGDERGGSVDSSSMGRSFMTDQWNMDVMAPNVQLSTARILKKKVPLLQIGAVVNPHSLLYSSPKTAVSGNRGHLQHYALNSVQLLNGNKRQKFSVNKKLALRDPSFVRTFARMPYETMHSTTKNKLHQLPQLNLELQTGGSMSLQNKPCFFTRRRLTQTPEMHSARPGLKPIPWTFQSK